MLVKTMDKEELLNANTREIAGYLSIKEICGYEGQFYELAEANSVLGREAGYAFVRYTVKTKSNKRKLGLVDDYDKVFYNIELISDGSAAYGGLMGLKEYKNKPVFHSFDDAASYFGDREPRDEETFLRVNFKHHEITEDD